MIDSIKADLVARAETSTPFTLAIVWRSSRDFDSRSERSGVGFTAIGIPFSPLAKVPLNGEEKLKDVVWKSFPSAKARRVRHK
jgi:hypothetical protein